MRLLSTLLIWLLWSHVGCQGAVLPRCPHGKQFDEQLCFEINDNDKKSWFEAKEMCLSRGGTLASIQNQKQQNFLNDLVNDRKYNYWIGARTFKRWYWTNGDEITWFNWMEGEPNDNGGEEDRIQLWYGTYGDTQKRGHYKWNDENKDVKVLVKVPSKFICQFDNIKCEHSDDYCFDKSTDPWVFRCQQIGTSCYYFGGVLRDFTNSDEGSTWSQAKLACEKKRFNGEKGYLARVENPETQKKLIEFIENKDKHDRMFVGNYWIGATWKRDADRKWQWTDGTEVGFTNWGPYEPSNREEECVEVRYEGIWNIQRSQWNDRKCHEPNNFVCQYDLQL